MTIEEKTPTGGVRTLSSSDAEGVNTPIRAPGGYANAAVLTLHDSTDFANEVQGIYVGGTGNLTVVMPDDSTVLISAIPVGTFLPIRCKRINTTDSTATLVVGFW